MSLADDEDAQLISASMEGLEEFNLPKDKNRSILTPEQSRQLGEATVLLTVSQDYEAAQSILRNLITQAPNAPELWLTLATLFEFTDNDKQAFGANLIAAHLNSDPALFKRLAQVHKALMGRYH